MREAIRLACARWARRLVTSASSDSFSHSEWSALFTVRLSALSSRRGAMSKIVRAGLVTRIPSCVLTSRQARVLDRCTTIPGRRRSPGTVTSNGSSHRLQNPHITIAEPWLSAAPRPHARTAALARSCGVTARRPTE